MPQRLITGEPALYGVDPISGAIVDRDLITRPDHPDLGAIPRKGEMISVVLNSVFIRRLEPRLQSHVLMYAEIYDDGNDDPASAITRVLFDQDGQPAGVGAGLSDRLLYGPTPFKGFPLRIKFFVVELAKEQKQTVNRLIDGVGTIASTSQLNAGPAIGLILRAAKLVNELTDDAYELRFDMTLYPVSAIGKADLSDPTLARFNLTHQRNEPTQRQGKAVALVTPLHVGQYVVIKRELRQRFRGPFQLHAETISFDWTQEAFVSSYADAGGNAVNVQEFLRATGGSLNWWVGKIAGKEVVVVPRGGPNAGVKTVLSPGVRSRAFDDQTYAMFSVLSSRK